jgi:hypothetical protein
MVCKRPCLFKKKGAGIKQTEEKQCYGYSGAGILMPCCAHGLGVSRGQAIRKQMSVFSTA